MYELAIRAKNYKCFKDETGFECIRRVNLIIGRNNAGKSTLLDLIEIVVAEKYDMARSTWRNNQQPQVIFEAKIPEDVVNNVFPPNTSGGTIPNRNHNAYGQAYIGKTLKWIKSSGAPNTASFVECDDEEEIYPTLINSGYSDVLSNRMPIPLEGKVFRRLLAERDILPEKAQSKNITIGTNGNGLTNAIQNFINKSDLPSALVESSILNALNTIFCA
jgi:putative ATP-dependent endonuclease of OLD family